MNSHCTRRQVDPTMKKEILRFLQNAIITDALKAARAGVEKVA